MRQPLKSWLFRSRISVLPNIKVRPAFTGLTFLIFYHFSNAQINLVPNHSFEIFTNCPTGPSQLNYAAPWTSPPNNDADYLNACSQSSYSLPITYANYSVYAKEGQACAGLWAVNFGIPDYREYIQINLSDTLFPGKCYFASFYAVLIKPSQFAVGDLAFSFSQTSVNSTGTGSLLQLPPHVYPFNRKTIDDTLNWVIVQGLYYPSQHNQYLTIGNFNNDSTTTISLVDNGTYSGSYYLIDKITVAEATEPAWTYNDTSVIIGDSVFIGNLMSGLNCTWYLNGSAISNAPGFYVSPTVNSDYIIEMNICGSLFYDTVTVQVEPNTVQTGVKIQQEAKIYPNPTSGEFTVIVPQEKRSDWYIVVKDVDGRKIFEKFIPQGETLSRISTSAQSGVYMVYITNTTTNVTGIKKLVIQK